MLQPYFKFIIGGIFYLILNNYTPSIAIWGTLRDTLPQQTLEDLVNHVMDNLDDEEVGGLQNMLHQIEQRAEREPISKPNDNLFGWSSLYIFIGLSILGYFIIKHGSDVFTTLRSLFFDISHDVTAGFVRMSRAGVRDYAHQLLNNPETQEQVIILLNTIADAPRPA